MTDAEVLFHRIAQELPNVSESKMFGALGLKAPNGKTGVMFWQDSLAVKLDETSGKEALNLSGAKVFDPMGGRPMTGWVQLPFEHSALWKGYAERAMNLIKVLPKKDRKISIKVHTAPAKPKKAVRAKKKTVKKKVAKKKKVKSKARKKSRRR